MYNDSSSNSSDLNLALLLGIQSWRYGYFFLSNIQNIGAAVSSGNYTDEEKDALEDLFAYSFANAG